MASSPNMFPAGSPLPPAPEKKERLLFELRFKEVGLLQQALKIMVSAAACPDGLSLAGTGRNEDSGDLHVLSGGEVFLVVKTIISPDVDACLALKPFATFVVPAGLVLCLNLRSLEKEMNDTVVEGLTLGLKGGDKLGEIACCLIKGNDNVEHSSVIPVISTRFGADADQIRSYWKGLENSFVLSFQFSVQSLNQVMGYKGSPVHIKVTQNAVLIEVGDNIKWLRERVGEFTIMDCSQEYSLTMQFTSFHLRRDAIMNAVALSEILMFHLTSDSRCVLEIFVNRVGSIHFCFKAN